MAHVSPVYCRYFSSQDVRHDAAAGAVKLGLDTELHVDDLDRFASFSGIVPKFVRSFPQDQHRMSMLSPDHDYRHEVFISS